MVKFEKYDLKKETYVDKIIEIIEYRITSGELKPDEKISETALAKEFNVSRGPAREALLRLEDMDLVLKTYTGRVIKGFSIDEFRENYELKTIVEAYCCMQGAYKATERDIFNIREILDKIRPLVISEKHKNRLLLTSKFHESLVLCSQNKKLVEIYRAQTKQFNWSKCFSTIKFPRAKEAHEDHLKIFEAFANKDGERVRKLTEVHQNGVLEIMLENLRKRSEGTTA